MSPLLQSNPWLPSQHLNLSNHNSYTYPSKLPCITISLFMWPLLQWPKFLQGRWQIASTICWKWMILALSETKWNTKWCGYHYVKIRIQINNLERNVKKWHQLCNHEVITDAFSALKRVFTLLYYCVALADSGVTKLITFREEPVSVLNDGLDHRDHVHRGGGCHLSQRPAKEVHRAHVLPLDSLSFLLADSGPFNYF